MTSKNARVVLITGANKGLGKEIARQLAPLGYTIIVAARDEQAGKAVADELVRGGYDARAVRLEATNPDHIAEVVSYLDKTFGKLDVLVNNAGIAPEFDGKGSSVERVRQTLEVNLVAPFALTEALVPLLAKSDDARVINQSSMLGSLGMAESMWDQVTFSMHAGYSASKAGLNMLTLIQSKRLAEKGILVAAAHPGWVKTDLGGSYAPMEVQDGAKTVVGMVTIARGRFPSGQLQHMGERLPW